MLDVVSWQAHGAIWDVKLPWIPASQAIQREPGPWSARHGAPAVCLCGPAESAVHTLLQKVWSR